MSTYISEEEERVITAIIPLTVDEVEVTDGTQATNEGYAEEIQPYEALDIPSTVPREAAKPEKTDKQLKDEERKRKNKENKRNSRKRCKEKSTTTKKVAFWDELNIQNCSENWTNFDDSPAKMGKLDDEYLKNNYDPSVPQTIPTTLEEYTDDEDTTRSLEEAANNSKD
ncbi:uncharacterized protein [Watersipora subatra]|uniref:uncharacterized protein n=1 Tax=Watersipora subatra TaxID=2589382 RepID=UPI00355C1634